MAKTQILVITIIVVIFIVIVTLIRVVGSESLMILSFVNLQQRSV